MSGSATAQIAQPPLARPNERPFQNLPQPSGDEPATPRLKHPRQAPPENRRELEAAGPENRLHVETLRFIGNQAISDVELGAVALPFLGRAIGPRELRALLVALTRTYVDAGYVNSGATLTEQQVTDGVLDIQIVEGRLGDIQIEGLKHYRSNLLIDRLLRKIETPLRVEQVEEVLRLFQRDNRIRRIDARVAPTKNRGVATLILHIEEERPYWTDFIVDNHAPASVGTVSGTVATGHDNLFGLGDRLYAEATFTEGLWRARVGYEIPVGPFGTSLTLETRQSAADIVQPPFDALDIETSLQSYSATLRQPIVESLGYDLAIGLIGEHRRGRTSLLGDDAPLAAGSDRGRIRLSLLRPFVEWTLRRKDYAIALRSVATFGLGTPGATKSPGKTPDGRFFAWLGQARGIYRHPKSQIEVYGRFDIQLTDDALLPLEEFVVGGPESVRGYPRNFLVRDQGLSASLEARVPMYTNSKGRRVVELIPFVDLGRAWNRDRVTRGIRTLSSLGIGLRMRPVPPLTIDIEWAQPIRNVDRSGDHLQGRGLLLSARWRFR